VTTCISHELQCGGLGCGPTPEINAINTVWVLIAAFLVFCMQVGFEMLEAGFARSREAVNILLKASLILVFGGLRSGWGFCFHVLCPGTPFIGLPAFSLQALTGTYGSPV